MSFDFSTLITDRTYADVSRVKELTSKIRSGTASESELAEFNSAAMKGAYNHTDLNRVTAAMEALKAKLEGYGYAVPGYQRIKVPHVFPEPEPTSRLPEGYLELTYIESTGAQHINTKFKPNQNTRVVMYFENLGVPGSYSASVAAIYGTRNGSSSGCYVCWIGDAATYPQYGNVTYNGNGSISVNTKTRLVYEQDGFLFKTNGQTISCSQDSFSANNELLLLAANSAGTVDGRKAAGKLYFCQIYDNGVLIRDYVPCINPDGVVGLYDLVTAAFFGNSGTGSFVAGAIPRELPEGYTQVEYIESTGTQYIDTGFKPSGEDMQVVFDFAYTASHSASSLFGTESNSNYTIVPYNQPAFYVAKSTALLAQTTALNTRYVLDAHANNGTFTLVFNGIESVAAYSGSLSKDLSVFLLASNKNGSATQFTSAKLYSCKIYDNGVLVRDYVPCKNASGVVGLYDIANGVFYQNAGTGAFAAGEEVAAPVAAAVSVASVIDGTEYDPHTWYEFDWPTPETMTLYLLNVAAIRSVLAVMKSTPRTPVDAVGFMVQEANDIEVILLDVYAQLLIMPTTFVACGEAICGGDNL